MKRRPFLQIVSATFAACFLSPLRAAKAVQRRVTQRLQQRPLMWLTGRKHWEHLEQPIPHPGFARFVEGAPDGKIVCRVLGATHFHTNLHPDSGEFEMALEEAGWSPEGVQRRVQPDYDPILGCELCYVAFFGRCRAHRA